METWQKIVRCEEDVASRQLDPGHVCGGRQRAIEASQRAIAKIKDAELRIRREVGVERRAELRQAGVAEEDQLDAVIAGR